MKDYSKKERQQKLKELIAQKDIGDQNHLLAEIKKLNFDATQATISRDLQELGVIKIRVGPGSYKYEITPTIPKDVMWNKLRVLFDNFVLGMKSTNNMILIRTSPGNAHGVASLLDTLEIESILGTIAGDDTVLVIMDTVDNRKKVEKEFEELMEVPSSP